MLYKIHPLECDYGMGYTDYYLRRIDKDWKTSPKKRDYVDLFLSTTIAYGNMGWLVKDWGLDDPFGVEVMARSYYMMQQLQQQYAFILPRIPLAGGISKRDRSLRKSFGPVRLDGPDARRGRDHPAALELAGFQ